MGLFRNKTDNRVKCPECNGAAFFGTEIQNPEPRPQGPAFRTYGSSDGTGFDFGAYYNYKEKITVFDKCKTCNGKGKVDPDIAKAYRTGVD